MRPAQPSASSAVRALTHQQPTFRSCCLASRRRSTDKARELFLKKALPESNPMNLAREPGAPCGLRVRCLRPRYECLTLRQRLPTDILLNGVLVSFRMWASTRSLLPSISPRVTDPDRLVLRLPQLGATCYANALLQTWFHNADFRQIIYSLELLTTDTSGLQVRLASAESSMREARALTRCRSSPCCAAVDSALPAPSRLPWTRGVQAESF